MIRCLQLRRGDVADRFEESPMVKPIYPFERGVLDGVKSPPRTAVTDDLRLEQADDRFGECVVVRVAHAAPRRLRTGLGQALGVPDRQILAAAIAVMYHAVDSRARPDR